MWRTFCISFTTVAVAIVALGFLSLVGPSCGVDRIQRVDADFNAIGSSLKTYRLNAGQYPSTEQGLEALVEEPAIDPLPRRWTKIADRIPTDAWNNEYRYRRLSEDHPVGFEIISAGRDAQFGTEDDLSSLDPDPPAKP